MIDYTILRMMVTDKYLACRKWADYWYGKNFAIEIEYKMEAQRQMRALSEFLQGDMLHSHSEHWDYPAIIPLPRPRSPRTGQRRKPRCQPAPDKGGSLITAVVLYGLLFSLALWMVLVALLWILTAVIY